MSSTPSEFIRILRQLFADQVSLDSDGLSARIRTPELLVAFHLTPLPPRRIALLSIDRMMLEIELLAGKADHLPALLSRIDRATQRGGG